MDPLQRASTNQAAPLVGYDAVSSDAALVAAVRAFAGDDAPEVLSSLEPVGRLAGSAEAREHGMLANQNEPVHHPVDRYGNRVDEIAFHPSWHWMMRQGIGFGLHATPWVSDQPQPHLRRAAAYVAWTHNDPGHGCPLTMTYAAVPALRADDAQAKQWTALLASTSYDFGLRNPAEKTGILAGMGMTEKQGGSDVRTNVTTATPTAVDGEYVLHGHKWFTSAPMNDLFLVLAQAPGGLTCFVVPRVLPDGTRNPLQVVRLKDKLGNRSNASSELEFAGTWGVRLGDEGRGVRTIIEMVASTRLDCVLGSSALMRRSVAEATWHAAQRSAFGAPLSQQPAMQNVLADLAIESEAATLLGLRLAASVERSDDEHEKALRRIALPLAKFWVCKRTPFHVAEALEVLGGNGYVEESGMPLLFRESPLNSIWEGSGNVNALDVLRALQREPQALEAWLTEMGAVRGYDPRVDGIVDDVLVELADLDDAEFRARRIAGQMAVALQASLLIRHSDPGVSDAFVASRIGGDWAGAFGTLPRGVEAARIAERATPILG
ncbi:acyl-CoA dehydrogenase family protein [Mumia sp. zg.B21]|uniref:acyl-CoA dehydrogenase family protein n=1 Tax=Mumia sp. zg.B21 TaxID=2855447 RepID=UPI001C6E5C8E|nr:acyl-CoA dehydrogenase family protein [Mumia sp. zg.B21]MBW9211597.1 acyl-CoA dehydrogenase family protein [Mumia sp. zg.B21]